MRCKAIKFLWNKSHNFAVKTKQNKGKVTATTSFVKTPTGCVCNSSKLLNYMNFLNFTIVDRSR